MVGYQGHVQGGVVIFDGPRLPDGVTVRIEKRDGDGLAERFADLVRQWRQDRPRGVDLGAMVTHPAYQRIVGLGPAAIPLILRELRREGGHWFWALHAITGENPVPTGSEGRVDQMTAAWLEWGRQEGYIGELD
jgi:hypothetical protein